ARADEYFFFSSYLQHVMPVLVRVVVVFVFLAPQVFPYVAGNKRKKGGKGPDIGTWSSSSIFPEWTGFNSHGQNIGRQHCPARRLTWASELALRTISRRERKRALRPGPGEKWRKKGGGRGRSTDRGPMFGAAGRPVLCKRPRIRTARSI
ncbi:hypothetical protein L249_1578, partial [Ophiocordyceps polyrhachis-furcata BCC 54312]